MTQRELQQMPECSATSQLQNIDEPVQTSADALLFIVSEKGHDTDTGYMSKNITYGQLARTLSDSMEIAAVKADVEDISAVVVDLEAFRRTRLSVCGDIVCNELPEEPYIISAIQLSDTLIHGLSGYYLSGGMDMVFKRHEFNQICAESIWLDGNKLNYEDLIKDQFLSTVYISEDNKMVFIFKLEDGEPTRPVEIELSNLAGSVAFRDWTV